MCPWFAAECPVDDETRRWIDHRWRWLTDQLGAERAWSAPVILPTPEFFPDDFDHTGLSALKIFERVCGYMEVESAAVEMTIYSDRNPVHDDHGLQTTTGLHSVVDGTHRIGLEERTLADPLLLVATMARKVSRVHLLGRDGTTAETEDLAPLADLAAVFLGMGVILANSVIRESISRSTGTAGWSMSRQGSLSMPMFGYSLARFADARNEVVPSWETELRPDVRSPFAAARRWLVENPEPRSSADLSHPIRESPVEPEPVIEAVESTPSEVLAGQSLEAPQIARRHVSAAELLRRYADGERDFHGIDLTGEDLDCADLREIDLSNSDLTRTSLAEANLAEANLNDADMESTRLARSILRRATLRRADLSNAVLDRADLTGTDIRDAVFIGASVRGARIHASLWNRLTDFTDVDLATAECDAAVVEANPRGDLVTEKMVERFDRIRRFILCCVVGGLGFLVGGVVLGTAGHIFGAFVKERGWDDLGGIAGGTIGAVVAVAIAVRSRR